MMLTQSSWKSPWLRLLRAPPCCRVLARVCGPGGGCLVARPPPCWPRSSCPGLAVLLFVAVFAVWGVGAGVGGVGVVSAH